MSLTCNSDIIKYKESHSIPHYFQLQEGQESKISFWGQRRVEYFERKLADAKGSSLKILFVIAIFGIPAVVGKILDSLVHSIKAEKISKEYYETEFNEWMTKTFQGSSIEPAFYKNFIDFCIRNKIKAKDCPHQGIICRRLIKNGVHYIFEGDGCAPKLRQHFVSKSDKKNPGYLVLWSPKTTEAATEAALNFPEKNFYHLSSPEIRNFFIGYENRFVDLISKCAFTVFAPWTHSNSHIIIDNVRQAVEEKL